MTVRAVLSQRSLSEQASDQTESDQQPEDAVENDVDPEHPHHSFGEDRTCHRQLMLSRLRPAWIVRKYRLLRSKV
jgi:hypothetical protein